MTTTIAAFDLLTEAEKSGFAASLATLHRKPEAVREAYRLAAFFGMNSTVSASGDSNAKLKKGSKAETLGINLLPADGAGNDVCPNRTAGCTTGCLGTEAGRNVMTSVQSGKAKRNRLFFASRTAFYLCIAWEISRLVRRAEKRNTAAAVRLNVTSDLRHEKLAPWIFAAFPTVQFYDYTKGYARVNWKLPANYDITLSWHEESTEADLYPVVNGDARIAVVFDEIPETWKGLKVINGDETDARWLDDTGVVVGLRAKGGARNDTTGFVQRVAA